MESRQRTIGRIGIAVIALVGLGGFGVSSQETVQAGRAELTVRLDGPAHGRFLLSIGRPTGSFDRVVAAGRLSGFGEASVTLSVPHELRDRVEGEGLYLLAGGRIERLATARDETIPPSDVSAPEDNPFNPTPTCGCCGPDQLSCFPTWYGEICWTHHCDEYVFPNGKKVQVAT